MESTHIEQDDCPSFAPSLYRTRRFDARVIAFVDGAAIVELPPDHEFGPLSASRKGSMCFAFDGVDVERACRVASAGKVSSDNGRQRLILEFAPDEALSEIIRVAVTEPDLRGAKAVARLMPLCGESDAAASKDQRKALLRRGAAGLAMVLVAAAVFAGSAYARLFSTDFKGFVATSDVSLLRVDRSGTFHTYAAGGDRMIAKDEIIGILETRNGRAAPVKSPCDCFLGDNPVRNGQLVSKDTVVARLINRDARLNVVVSAPLSQLWGIRAGDRAEIRTPVSQAPVPGRIVEIDRDRTAAVSATNDAGSVTRATLRIETEQPLDPASVGVEVSVKLVHGRGALDRLFQAD